MIDAFLIWMISVTSFLRAATLACFATFTATSALAEDTLCQFSKWRGAPADIAMTWTGTAFMLRSKGNQDKIVLLLNEKTSPWIDVDRSSNGRFDTFVYRRTAGPAPGFIRNGRFSFRIYPDGRCKGFVEVKGFSMLEATGTVR